MWNYANAEERLCDTHRRTLSRKEPLSILAAIYLGDKLREQVESKYRRNSSLKSSIGET